jgi:WD40 repeat protein
MESSDPPGGLTLAATLKGHTSRIAKPAWSRDGSHLASGSDDGTVRIWSSEGWNLVRILTPSDGVPIGRVEWSPRGGELAAGSADGTVRVWDTLSGELLSSLCSTKPDVRWSRSRLETDSRPLIRDVSWSGDGSVLAIASDDYTVRTWHVRSNSVQTVYAGHDRVTSVAFSPAGTLLAAGTDDSIVAILRGPTEAPVLLHGHRSYVLDLAWSHDGSWLASASGDGTIRIWDPIAQETKSVLEGHHSLIGGVSISFDDRLLASKSIDDKVRLWRADRWELVATLDEECYGGAWLWHDSIAFHPCEPVLV